MSKKVRGIDVVDQWEKLGHQDCKHWLFRVWDKRRRSYKSEAFAELSPGWAWAETERARLTLGLSVSGRVLLAAVAQEYIGICRDNGKKDSYCDDMERVVNAVVGAGAVDMNSDSFADTAFQWLKSAPSFTKHRSLPLSPATRNKYFIYLRTIVGYARDTRLITHNPFVRYDFFKTIKRAKDTLTLSEIVACLTGDAEKDAYFHRFALAIYTGRRIQEAVHSRWEWHDWPGRMIAVRAHPDYDIKRDKERFIPMQPEYYDLFYPLRKESGWIITDPALRAQDDKEAWVAFRAFLKRRGVIERVKYPKTDAKTGKRPVFRRLSPHSARHSYIALRLATGESITQVRREAGHDELVTTDGYADSESTYRTSVADWPRGELCFRSTPEEHRNPPEESAACEHMAANVIVFPRVRSAVH